MAAAITTSNPADFANRLQTYFSRQLLKALTYNLKLASYGTAKDLPANSAAYTIRFFRPRKATRGNGTVGPRVLTEGTPPTANTTVAVGYVDCTLRQRGDLTSLSDIVQAVDLFDTAALYSTTMGADAALDYDGVCSHAIVSKAGTADADGTPNPIPAGQTTMYNYNTNATAAGNTANNNFERFTGVAPTGNSQNDFTSLQGLSNANSKLTRAVHLGAVTRLKGVAGQPGVPMIGGKYVVLCPNEVLFDIRQDSVWIAAAVYNNIKQIQLFPWAEFELDGCVFVESQNPFIENKTGGSAYAVYDPSAGVAGSIYSVLYLGQDAFGVPKLSGKQAGSNPAAPSLIMLSAPDKADPLGQITTLGWKAFYSSILLLTSESTDVPHVVVQRCQSTYA